MYRKKKKEAASSGSKQVSVAIQCNIDCDEITHLEEQLKVLQLKYETLKKKHVDDDDLDVLKNSSKNVYLDVVKNSKPKKRHLLEIESGTIDKKSFKQKSCSCKGNCSTKTCGCVKHKRICGPNCKCKNQSCKNKKLENKENEESIKNDILDNVQEYEKTILNNEAVDTSFDPMKPKRQLPRTPPRVNVENESSNVSMTVETPTEKTIENVSSKEDIPEELHQENVDLNELKIELVQCNKCKRKFYPWRVEVHQSVCHQL